MAAPRVVLYVLRRDIRLSDNPIFHYAAQQVKRNQTSKPTSGGDQRSRDESLTSGHGGSPFTHFLPLYIFPAHQIEISGFLSSPSEKSPYPEARSKVAKVWRTGPHRAKFIGQGVWDLKQRLEGLACGSGLEMRVGMVAEVVRDILDSYSKLEEGNGCKPKITGVWMTDDDGTEEKDEMREVQKAAAEKNVPFKVFADEKFFIDDRDLPFQHISDLPNVYTTYRKSLEPLRDQPRNPLPTPTQLPPLPPHIPEQKAPFKIPTTEDDLLKAIMSPFEHDPTCALTEPPVWPTDAESAHPFAGGETTGLARIAHLISGGAMSSYKATRNGMLGLDFSTKLSAFLAQGQITARQVHRAMLDFEEGKGAGEKIAGYGKGENEGTAAVRFELLWRDYMRLCMRKFGNKMFALYGIQPHVKGRGEQPPKKKTWRMIHKSNGAGDDPRKTLETFQRFRSGRTGVGLIDASARELFCTGYTSNRARQNVASFLSSHLDIDWRIGAEWYEMLLIDYDVASNWGNWQYVAGVGNDPRQGRIFNPVKQAFDYDAHGEYIKAWVPELRDIKLTRTTAAGKEEYDQQRLMLLYQAWRLSDWEKNQLGLKGVEWVEQPLTRIQFSVGRKGPPDGRPKRGGGASVGGGGGHWRGGGGRGRGSRDFRRVDNEDRNVSFKREEGPTIVTSSG
ncbi:DNA photolyase, FAD-binding/Cryptochrome [Ampelomyces quisqualis]|uniref:Cryptochrome DASH n=1 Tax=Ampelomyces quisqualis TaxID=50730 RepID=A0A6A5QRZ0_AMPQU|nr:DNA photolyase, FAD-binding/Cryptochrome [Ampelomyces quisqualis]